LQILLVRELVHYEANSIRQAAFAAGSQGWGGGGFCPDYSGLTLLLAGAAAG